MRLEESAAKAMLFLAPKIILPYDMRKSVYAQAVKRYERRFDAITQLGCDTKIIAGRTESTWSTNTWRFANDFEGKRPGSVIRIEITEKRDYVASIWPRDIFQSIGSTVYVTPGYERIVGNIFYALGLPLESMKFLRSDVGQGGYVVRDQSVIVLSDKVSDDIGPEQLLTEGYSLYQLPTPNRDHPDRELAQRMRNGHIDTEFNLVFSPRGHALICVSERYRMAFRDEVESVASELDASLLEVKRESADAIFNALNFISLPGNHVMLPKHCERTRDFLRWGLGHNNVHEVLMRPNDYSGRGGGLRCMTNVILI